MQRILLISVLATACTTADGTGTTGTGTVIYSEANTGHLHAVDVASGEDRLIDDGGAFGSLSMAADREHVAYVGTDGVVRVTDLRGNITALELPNGSTPHTGCGPGPTWGPNNSLTYCIYDEGFSSFGFVPAPGAPVRKLIAYEVAVSNDAAAIVYQRRDVDPTQLGDVVVENADGSGQRVLARSIIERAFMFTPDGLHVVAVAENPVAFHVVMHTLADGAVTELGPGDLPRPIAGGSSFSPDGSELLAVLGSELVAVQPTTGARRHFATLGAGVTIGSAAFIDADHVIYHRREDTTVPGSDVIESAESIRIASASDEITVMPQSGFCAVRAIAVDAGLAAVECNNAAILSFDGTIRASNDALFALGISADDMGIVTIADNGSVTFLATDGQMRTLATAMNRGTLVGPVAAYAP